MVLLWGYFCIPVFALSYENKGLEVSKWELIGRKKQCSARSLHEDFPVIVSMKSLERLSEKQLQMVYTLQFDQEPKWTCKKPLLQLFSGWALARSGRFYSNAFATTVCYYWHKHGGMVLDFPLFTPKLITERVDSNPQPVCCAVTVDQNTTPEATHWDSSSFLSCTSCLSIVLAADRSILELHVCLVQEFGCIIEAFSQQPASGGFCAPRCVQIKENSPIIISDPKVQFRESYMGELDHRVQKSILCSLCNRSCHSQRVLMRAEMFSSSFFQLSVRKSSFLAWFETQEAENNHFTLRRQMGSFEFNRLSTPTSAERARQSEPVLWGQASIQPRAKSIWSV